MLLACQYYDSVPGPLYMHFIPHNDKCHVTWAVLLMAQQASMTLAVLGLSWAAVGCSSRRGEDVCGAGTHGCVDFHQGQALQRAGCLLMSHEADSDTWSLALQCPARPGSGPALAMLPETGLSRSLLGSVE